MKFSVAKLLSQLHPDTPTTIPQLQKKLSLSAASEKTQLDIALTALKALGLLRHQDGRIYLQSHDHLVPARLRSSSKGFCFAMREGGGGDIYIRDQHLNHAWDGDRILVKIVREGGRRRSPEGIVQCVLERAHGTLLAVPKRSDHGLIAQPLDDRLPHPIQLPEEDGHHLDASDHAVAAEVCLDRFPIGQDLAQGKIIRSLSTSGGEHQDQRLIQTKHGIFGRSSRSRAVLQPLDLRKREDLRTLPTLLLEGYGVWDAPTIACPFPGNHLHGQPAVGAYPGPGGAFYLVGIRGPLDAGAGHSHLHGPLLARSGLGQVGQGVHFCGGRGAGRRIRCAGPASRRHIGGLPVLPLPHQTRRAAESQGLPGVGAAGVQASWSAPPPRCNT